MPYPNVDSSSDNSQEQERVKTPGSGLLTPTNEGVAEKTLQVILPKGFHVIDPKK